MEAELQIDPETRSLRPVHPRKILYTTFNTIDHEKRLRDFERFQVSSVVCAPDFTLLVVTFSFNALAL